MAKIYGYGRMSTSTQVASPDTQRHLIEEKAATMLADADWAYTRFDEAVSAYKVRWNARPEFRKLMAELQPGDHLIVWRLDRLERRMWGMIHCVEWLNNRGVILHILQYHGAALDLDTAMGKITITLWAGFAELYSEQLGQTVRDAVRSRKERGLPYCSVPMLGKRRRKRIVNNKTVLDDSWDEEQCDIIRELSARYSSGESVFAIGADFEQRGLRDWRGRLWGRRDKANIIIARSLYDAFWRRTEWLAEGHDLGDLPVPPELQEVAIKLVADREKRRTSQRRRTSMSVPFMNPDLANGDGLRISRKRKAARRRTRKRTKRPKTAQTGGEE